MLSSRTSLRLISLKKGFAGAIYLNTKDNDFTFGVYEIPVEVEEIYVELKDVFVDYIIANIALVKNKEIIFFETYENEVYIYDNNRLSDEKRSLVDGLNKKIKVLKDYENVLYHTHGEISPIDANAIYSLVNSYVEGYRNPINAIEIGTWMGCSTYFYAKAIGNEYRNNKLFCIDTWGGSYDVPNHQIAEYLDIFGNFRSYMKYFGIYETLKPMMMESKTALEALKDDYFDVIFIDADHRYENVYYDIKESIKKLHIGGLILGHDCECYAVSIPTDVIEKSKNKDFCLFENKIYHTGVISALNEIFGGEYSIYKESTVWYKIITEKDKTMI